MEKVLRTRHDRTAIARHTFSCRASLHSSRPHIPCTSSIILVSGDSDGWIAVWSSPPSEAKNNARSWIRTKDLFITSETLSRRCQRWRIWIEQTYTPEPNGLVLRLENESFSRLPHLFLLVIPCFLQALSRDDAPPRGTCPLTSHTHEPPSKPLYFAPAVTLSS